MRYDARVARAIFASILALSAAAAAQENAEYQSLIAEAVTEFDAHRFAEARVLFRRAHQIEPNARTLRGIGLASFELADYVQAHRALKSSLDETRRALTEAQRAEVQSLLERTDRFLGIFTVTLAPASAVIEPPLEPDGTLLLALGTHTVRARAEGHREVERTVEVTGGERAELHFELEPLEGAPPPPPPPSEGRDWTLPGVLFGLGGALAVTSIVLGLTWWINRQDAVDQCTNLPAGSICNPAISVLEGERDVSIGVTLGLAAVGAALLVGGAIAAAAGPSEASAAVSCRPVGAGMSCTF